MASYFCFRLCDFEAGKNSRGHAYEVLKTAPLAVMLVKTLHARGFRQLLSDALLYFFNSSGGSLNKDTGAKVGHMELKHCQLSKLLLSQSDNFFDLLSLVFKASQFIINSPQY